MKKTIDVKSGKGSDNPLLQVFQEETISSSRSPWRNLKTNLTKWVRHREQTILATGTPLADSDLESFRVETLVSFNAAAALMWVRLPQEDALLQAKPKDFFRLLVGLATQPGLSREQSQFLAQLKNSLTVRSRLLTQPEIIVNIITQGIRSFLHTLDRVAAITSNKKCNKKITEYLKVVSETDVIAHAALFRKEIEVCQHQEDLERILARYKFDSYSTIKQYGDLKIIKAVKQVFEAYERDPRNLTRILNKYLGANSEANTKAKLAKLLVTSDLDAELLKKIGKEKSLQGIVAVLDTRKQTPQLAPHAEKLCQLVKIFAAPENRSSFADFKTSLNIFSPLLVSKVVAIGKSTVYQEFLNAVSLVLKSSDAALDRLQELDKILTSTRYHEPGILLYGYPPKVVYEKIHSVDGRAPNVENLLKHILTSSTVPQPFFALIAEAKREQLKGSRKNIDSCLQFLQKLQIRIQHHEVLQLRSELLNLFKSHGNIQFARQDLNVAINGYDIANIIGEFYNIPNRTAIDLPDEIQPDVRQMLKDMIDQERIRQLKRI